MKSVEFTGKLLTNGQIEIPPEVAQELPFGTPLQVIVLWNGSGSDAAWRDAAMERLAAAYCSKIRFTRN